MPHATNPSRDLLFGLLALQTGLIDQGSLFAAFNAWTRDKMQPLADHLFALGHFDNARRVAVEAIVAVHLQSMEGDIEKSLAALQVNRATRESLAQAAGPDLEATLGRVGSAGPPNHVVDDDAGPDCTCSLTSRSATTDGQRFQVVRPYAQGGLGTVSVAVDHELHREVALKQILEKHADDPASRQRFIAEAEINGALEHPGVVPVYGLGMDNRGRPYYAMRFIKGDSLKEAIANFHASLGTGLQPVSSRPNTARMAAPPKPLESGKPSLELRKLLRRFLDVCNAIDYAHSRGVIHRDIKPANIILGTHGETLVVDWGLAKSIGRADRSIGERTVAPASSGASDTLAGCAMGTPAYMSPEQARGQLNLLGPRSDVYSLGTTLYCLLTGKPPFEGENVGAVLHAVDAGRFPAPRQINSTLDRPLEAICLKAMANQAQDRYATPKALADDLERWMADEPVTAWNEPVTRRIVRWLSRRRTAVTAAAAAVLAGVVGLLAVLGVQSAANSRLSSSLTRETKANVALAAANTELMNSKAAVQARYELAVDAIKTFHTGVSEDFLLRENQFKGVRDRRLKSASDFYAKLGALLDKETDFASRRALAQSHFELAELAVKVGRRGAALAEHRAVLAAREAMAAEPAAGTDVKIEVGQSMSALAALQSSTGKIEEAKKTYQQAETLLSRLVATEPTARPALAQCRSSMADLLFRTGDYDGALKAYEQARTDQEALVALPKAPGAAYSDLAGTLYRLASLELYYSNLDRSVKDYRASLAILQNLEEDDPGNVDLKNGLAAAHSGLAAAYYYTDRLKQAVFHSRAAIAISQRLVDENPAVTSFAGTLSQHRTLLGWTLIDMGKASEAESEYVAALKIKQKHVDDHPEIASFRFSVAGVRYRLGELHLQNARRAEAESETRAAYEMIQTAVDDYPSLMVYRNALPHAMHVRGDALRSLGRTAEARDLYERAIAMEEPAVRDNPGDPEYLFKLVGGLWRRGMTRRQLGEIGGAVADIRRAVRLCEGLPPRFVRYSFEKACAHAALAGLAARPGSGVSTAECDHAADRAMFWLRHAFAAGYRNVNAIQVEPSLDSLRSREDFRHLIMDMAFPEEPLAN
jgi:eukaryotic-like serine/threonine-protein kinase